MQKCLKQNGKKKMILKKRNKRRAQGLIEYALILGLICIVAMAAVVSMRGESEELTALKAIAAAETRQAKAQEEIVRWLWSPDEEKHDWPVCVNAYINKIIKEAVNE